MSTHRVEEPRPSVRVLVVDDHDETRELITLMLARRGFTILATNRGASALAAAVDERPDVILLDVMMPEMDGFTVLRRLKGDARTAAIPVIVVTAKVQEQVRSDAYTIGADYWIGKPFTRDELVAGIRAVLRRHG